MPPGGHVNMGLRCLRCRRLQSSLAALRERNLALIVSGVSISALGSGMSQVALAFAELRISSAGAGGARRGQQAAALVVERVGAAERSREGIDRVCDLRVDDH